MYVWNLNEQEKDPLLHQASVEVIKVSLSRALLIQNK